MLSTNHSHGLTVHCKDHPERQATRQPTEYQPCSLAALLCPGSSLRLASASQPHLISPKPTLAPCREQEFNKCQLLSLIIIMGAMMNQPLTMLSDLTVHIWSYGLSGWAADWFFFIHPSWLNFQGMPSWNSFFFFLAWNPKGDTEGPCSCGIGCLLCLTMLFYLIIDLFPFILILVYYGHAHMA